MVFLDHLKLNFFSSVSHSYPYRAPLPLPLPLFKTSWSAPDWDLKKHSSWFGTTSKTLESIAHIFHFKTSANLSKPSLFSRATFTCLIESVTIPHHLVFACIREREKITKIQLFLSYYAKILFFAFSNSIVTEMVNQHL